MDPELFRSVLPEDRFEEFEQGTELARRLLAESVVWNINSTAKGGGVVELLRPLLAYARGAGIDARWLVIEGPPEFFELTKRLHNRLHGSEGDGGALDEEARGLYEHVLEENASQFLGRIDTDDIVIVHDPQPAGLVPALRSVGATVIWRCHIGIDEPNDIARQTWDFLRPYIEPAQACVFSRESFVWEGLDRDRIAVIRPTIDAFAPKNVDLDPEFVSGTLQASGIVAGSGGTGPTFRRQDGSPGRIERRAQMTEDEPLPMDTPVLVQVSRWDALKDPIGVIRGFAEHVPADTGAHLLYAGPAVEAVADDPEGERMLRDSLAARQALPEEQRARVHLASLPVDDVEENAIMVNALQRHATVIAQKSIAEGFGLTVAEAMWKARPVVASRIGGIQDQVVDGVTGLLLDDPSDLAAFGEAVTSLLRDPERSEEMGRAARERVRDEFLSVRSLLDYLRVIRGLIEAGSPQASSSTKSATESTTLEAR
jgi:trehalose synthase